MESVTKKRIADALTELMEKKSIDKITVKDVVDHCGITRQTFYYHYQDMFEVLEWIAREKADELLQYSLQAEDTETAVQHFLVGVLKNKLLINQLHNSRRHMQVEEIMFSMVRQYLTGMIKAKDLDKGLNSQDRETMLDFYSYALTGLLFAICRKKDIDIPSFTKSILHVWEQGLRP